MERTTARFARPAKDEWGVYDPQQAGLIALYTRLAAKDKNASRLQAPKVKKEITDPAPVRPESRGE